MQREENFVLDENSCFLPKIEEILIGSTGSPLEET
jgi:hypothetical protein